MTSKLLAAAIGALLVLPLCAQAQQSRSPADPADPAAPVPPTVYEPVISRHIPAPQGGRPTPDKAWRAANDALTAMSEHAGHSGHNMPGAQGQHHGHAAAPAPSKPAAPAAPEKQANPVPVDHSKHH